MLKILITAIFIDKAVLALFYKKRNCTGFIRRHNSASALHRFVNNCSPAFQIIAGEKKYIRPSHVGENFLRGLPSGEINFCFKAKLFYHICEPALEGTIAHNIHGKIKSCSL